MKTFFTQFVFVAVLFSSVISISYGDLLTKDDYIASNADLATVQINDATNDTNGGISNPLFRIFNEYFHDELTALGQSSYTSGNDLADDRMIRQTISSWAVNPGSQVVSSFTSSAYSHGLNIYDPTGELVFNSGIYGSTTTGEAKIDGQSITLAGGDYVFATYTDNIGNGKGKVFSGDHDWYYQSDEYLNSEKWQVQYYEDGVQHLIVFDVTDLMRQREGYETIESAFLFALEDLNIHSNYAIDFDYQDFAFVLTNVSANVVPPAAVPEPATALILGFAGTLVLPFLKRKRKGI
ncbi:MAG: hypothetical protein LBI18_12330 [Planctomycetaceae bacterium]|nr:hypothetical protein [Planctomycetaceae bacterium]